MNPTAVHKTFEKDACDKRDLVLYVSDGSSLAKVKRIVGDDKVAKFVETSAPGTTLRFTSVDASDQIILGLQDRGVAIEYAHWHATGLVKSLPPADIAYQTANLPSKIFLPVKADRNLVELRHAVLTRNAILQFYGDAVRRLKGGARNAGITDIAECEDYIESITTLTNIKKGMGSPTGVSWDTRVEHLAKDIPDCVLFAQIAGFDSMGTAAAVVAYTNGIFRFPDVASYWTYCGQGVVGGVAPKRKTGHPVNWSPKMRTTLYNMMESIVKHVENPWNAVYKEYKAEELAVHKEKCPGCKAPLGHSHNRAKRKVAKEILKRFYLAATAQAYVEGHNPLQRV